MQVLYATIYQCSYSSLIIIFTEPRLNENIFNSLLNPNEKYTLYRLDRNTNTHGGGILVHVNMHYNTYQINLHNNTFELISVSIYLVLDYVFSIQY